MIDTEAITEAAVMWLPSVPSTNTWMKEHTAECAHGFVVAATDQTAGRGQRGNFWEAEPGKNLTFSIMLRPDEIDAAHQFRISEAVALAVVEVLRRNLKEHVLPENVKVKWPNDIYVNDDKIAGILIENTLQGTRIQTSIAGVGINVNQTIFHSPAPNPVSMAQLAACSFPLPELLAELQQAIVEALAAVDGKAELAAAVHRHFHTVMWRNDGEPHRFALPDGSRFTAVIDRVEPNGRLLLTMPDGSTQSFAFKEVTFL